jgi:hypothetical protein
VTRPRRLLLARFLAMFAVVGLLWATVVGGLPMFEGPGGLEDRSEHELAEEFDAEVEVAEREVVDEVERDAGDDDVTLRPSSWALPPARRPLVTRARGPPETMQRREWSLSGAPRGPPIA